MRDLLRRTRTELRLLPFMLGKLVGGAMAAVGAGAAVVMVSGRPGTSPSDAPPYAMAALAGIIIFALSSRLLARRSVKETADDVTPAHSMRMSAISWTVLLLLAAGFLLVAFLITR